MQIGTINGITNLNSSYNYDKEKVNKNKAFEDIFQSALSMVNDTNQLTHDAEKAEISYALGLTNSTHDLQVAQEKANIALQYTLSVRNAVIESYKEIMNIQF